MIKFKDMMEMVINGQDSIICAVKDANADNAECINEMLLTGKYWIRSKQGGEIYPAIPKELWDADSAWGTLAYSSTSPKSSMYVSTSPCCSIQSIASSWDKGIIFSSGLYIPPIVTAAYFVLALP